MSDRIIQGKSCLKARVLNIQRMSTEDGPGIRTTVFFKGCGLKCLWCHNPESISPEPQIQWMENKCIGCKSCIKACPVQALSLTSEGIRIDRELCSGCGICVDECPSTAMELLGKTWGLEELVDEVLKDRAYFESSGGGITVSGGDPTVQAHFAGPFLRECHERGIRTALDTCGLCSTNALDLLLPYTDLVLYDVKHIDPEVHKKFTGHTNRRILQNIIHIRDFMTSHDYPGEIWVRTPLIPDATATEDNIRGIGEFLAGFLDGRISRWELCAFNNLCRDKYRRLGMEWHFKDTQLMDRETLDRLVSIAKKSGVDPDIIQWTGAARVKADTPGPEEQISKPHLHLVKGCGTY